MGGMFGGGGGGIGGGFGSGMGAIGGMGPSVSMPISPSPMIPMGMGNAMVPGAMPFMGAPGAGNLAAMGATPFNFNQQTGIMNGAPAMPFSRPPPAMPNTTTMAKNVPPKPAGQMPLTNMPPQVGNVGSFVPGLEGQGMFNPGSAPKPAMPFSGGALPPPGAPPPQGGQMPFGASGGPTRMGPGDRMLGASPNNATASMNVSPPPAMPMGPTPPRPMGPPGMGTTPGPGLPNMGAQGTLGAMPFSGGTPPMPSGPAGPGMPMRNPIRPGPQPTMPGQSWGGGPMRKPMPPQGPMPPLPTRNPGMAPPQMPQRNPMFQGRPTPVSPPMGVKTPGQFGPSAPAGYGPAMPPPMPTPNPMPMSQRAPQQPQAGGYQPTPTENARLAEIGRTPADAPFDRPGGGEVLYANQGAIRNQPMKPALESDFADVGGKYGVKVEVVSGGQTGERRTGSHRHDAGGAGDVKFKTADGRYLSMNNPQDRTIMGSIAADMAGRGWTGIGAGQDYMGPHTMHIGGGGKAVWGAGGKGSNAPPWLRSSLGSMGY